MSRLEQFGRWIMWRLSRLVSWIDRELAASRDKRDRVDVKKEWHNDGE